MHPEHSCQLSVAEITRFGGQKIERSHARDHKIGMWKWNTTYNLHLVILNFSEIATFSKHLYNSGVDKKKEELGEIWTCLVFSGWWMCLFFFLMLL